MYNYIIQLSTKPISEDSYITAEDFYSNALMNYRAEYVEDISEEVRNYVLDDLVRNGFIMKTIDTTKKMMLISKQKYFQKKFDHFSSIINSLTSTTLADFIGGKPDASLRMLWEDFDDHYGIYVADEHNNLITLDSFVRNMNDADEVYIGGIVGYKC